MKKRILSLALLIVIVAAILPGARGTGGICFIGVNDSVPQYLSAGEAPYYKGGALYIPYTVFNTGVGGVAVSYNVGNNSLVLFTRAKRLVYDLSAGTLTDENEKVSKVDTAHRNGVLFIPAAKALSHFGLSHAMLTSAAGSSVLRITDGSQKLDNTTFIRKAETLISIILEQEQKTTEKDSQPNGEKENEQQAPTGPVTVYFALAGEAVSEQNLELLERMGVSAAFFLTQQQMLQDKELVREIYTSGHQIGLAVEEGETDIAAALREANETLDQIVFFKTLMVLLPAGAVDMPQYAGFRERAIQVSVDDLLKDTTTAHFLVYRTDPSFILQRLHQEGAQLPQLLETSQIPGITS